MQLLLTTFQAFAAQRRRAADLETHQPLGGEPLLHAIEDRERIAPALAAQVEAGELVPGGRAIRRNLFGGDELFFRLRELFLAQMEPGLLDMAAHRVEPDHFADLLLRLFLAAAHDTRRPGVEI